MLHFAYMRRHTLMAKVLTRALWLSLIIPVVASARATIRDEAVTYRTRGYELQMSGALQDAMNLYQKAAAMDPTYATPHNDIGVLLEEQGRLAEAEQAYLRALAINPGYVEAHANLAMLYERLGNRKKAIFHWLKRYQLGDPQDLGTMRAKERLAALGVLDLATGEGVGAQPAQEPSELTPVTPATPPVTIGPNGMPMPNVVPQIFGNMRINEGAEVTNLPSVTLNMDVNSSQAALMQFSNDGKDYSSPEPLAATKPWILSGGDGQKTVYARLLEPGGKPLVVWHDQINLDTSPLTIYVTSQYGTRREQVDESLTANKSSVRDYKELTEKHGGWKTE